LHITYALCFQVCGFESLVKFSEFLQFFLNLHSENRVPEIVLSSQFGSLPKKRKTENADSHLGQLNKRLYK
jgi:hypothetical protein